MILPLVHEASDWMACKAAAQARNRHPALDSEPSESKLEGRACHEASQQLLERWKKGGVLDFTGIVGSLSKDGIVITQELFDAAYEYVNDVAKFCDFNFLTKELRVEQRVDLSRWLPGWYCIPDAWVYESSTNTVTVWDVKFGHSIVECFENWQLLIGAFGIIQALDIPEPVRQAVKLDLRVVQPRGFTSDGPTRRWFVTAGAEGVAKYWNELHRALPQVTGESPPCTTGPQCKNCSARANCDTLSRVAYEGIDFAGRLQTHTLSGHNLGVDLKLLRRAAKAIEYRLSGLEEQAIHEIKAGKQVSYFTAQQSKGRERWKKDVPHAEVIMMGDLLGVDIRKPVEMDTPSQVRKKGIDESVIAEYSETPLTGLKLVEVDGNKARQVFNNTQG